MKMFTLTDLRIDSLLGSLRDLLRKPETIGLIAFFLFEMGLVSLYGYQYCHAKTQLDRLMSAEMTVFMAGFVIMSVIAACFWNHCGEGACMFGRIFIAAYFWVWVMVVGFTPVFFPNG
jgi:hypothetical protein